MRGLRRFESGLNLRSSSGSPWSINLAAHILDFVNVNVVTIAPQDDLYGLAYEINCNRPVESEASSIRSLKHIEENDGSLQNTRVANNY